MRERSPCRCDQAATTTFTLHYNQRRRRRRQRQRQYQRQGTKIGDYNSDNYFWSGLLAFKEELTRIVFVFWNMEYSCLDRAKALLLMRYFDETDIDAAATANRIAMGMLELCSIATTNHNSQQSAISYGRNSISIYSL